MILQIGRLGHVLISKKDVHTESKASNLGKTGDLQNHPAASISHTRVTGAA